MNKNIRKICKLSPKIATENQGDFIIDEYCNDILEEIYKESISVEISTRDKITEISKGHIASSDVSFVLGTNLLASTKKTFRQWNMTIWMAYSILFKNVRKRELLNKEIIASKMNKVNIVLLGVGWWDYQDIPDRYMKKLFNIILSKNYMHSVRDSFTEQQLRSIGISNVLNTSCPTMWKLTEEHCKDIPVIKAKKVVTTLTNYRKNVKEDTKLLEILIDNYEQVYIWLQALEDLEYIHELGMEDKLTCIPPTLNHYDTLLKNKEIDYVGTRLHGGIRALNFKARTLIVAVDNRSLEISKDTNLPIIKREEVFNGLEEWIYSNNETQINLPLRNIEKWKNQFCKN